MVSFTWLARLISSSVLKRCTSVKMHESCVGMTCQLRDTYMEYWIASTALVAGKKSLTATSLFSFFLSELLVKNSSIHIVGDEMFNCGDWESKTKSQ